MATQIYPGVNCDICLFSSTTLGIPYHDGETFNVTDQRRALQLPCLILGLFVPPLQTLIPPSASPAQCSSCANFMSNAKEAPTNALYKMLPAMI